ncbi:TC3A [Enterospora canceri]|nr:TC3A [Enterospora canceri]
MTFVQDNASCHKSVKTIKWFKDQNIKLGMHPPQSPDLNPIENVWAWLKRRVNLRQHEIQNKADLWRVLSDEVSRVKPTEIRRHFISMPGRLKRLEKANFDII